MIAPLSVFIGDIGAIILDKVCGVKQIMMVKRDNAIISRAVCVYVWKSTASYSTKWRPPSRDVELVDKGIVGYIIHTHTLPLHCIPSLDVSEHFQTSLQNLVALLLRYIHFSGFLCAIGVIN